ncbi:MAG: hypothetical protein ACLUNZ_03505 [Evtepia sp.]
MSAAWPAWTPPPAKGKPEYEVGTDWAKKNGISDGTRTPHAPVTREQLVPRCWTATAESLPRCERQIPAPRRLRRQRCGDLTPAGRPLWANSDTVLVTRAWQRTIAPKDNAQQAQALAWHGAVPAKPLI